MNAHRRLSSFKHGRFLTVRCLLLVCNIIVTVTVTVAATYITVTVTATVAAGYRSTTERLASAIWTSGSAVALKDPGVGQSSGIGY